MVIHINGWNVETTRFYNAATHGGVEVCMESDHVQVDVTQGSGYMREQTSAYIPMEVIIRMMEHAGYTVTRQVCAECGNSNSMHGVSCSAGPA